MEGESRTRGTEPISGIRSCRMAVGDGSDRHRARRAGYPPRRQHRDDRRTSPLSHGGKTWQVVAWNDR